MDASAGPEVLHGVHAHESPAEAVDLPHPLGVPAGEVVVDRHDVDPPPAESVQVDGQGRDERLPLARPHLGDPPPVKDDPAHELDVEVTHLEGPLRRLPDDGECFRQQVVDRLARRQPLPEAVGHRAEFGIRHGRKAIFQRVDPVDRRPHPADLALVLRPEDLLENHLDHLSETVIGYWLLVNGYWLLTIDH